MKYNIGDKVKLKAGGFYVHDPNSWNSSLENSLTLDSSQVKAYTFHNGLITERINANGYNWYRTGITNWISEEGYELDGIVNIDLKEIDKIISSLDEI